jgi:hypothetical protein
MKIDSLVMIKLKKTKQNKHFLLFILNGVVFNSNKDLEIVLLKCYPVTQKFHSRFLERKIDDLSASLRKRGC